MGLRASVRAKLRLADVDHIILAISPDGDAVLRSTCASENLRTIAGMLVDIADQVEPGEGRPN